MKPRQTIDEAYAVQIEMACCAGVSGTLAEWPILRMALRDRGVDLPTDTPGYVVREACRKLHNEGAVRL